MTDIASIARDHNPWWQDPKHREALNAPERRPAFRAVREYLGEGHQHRALALLGPRQVGKTTLLRQLIDDRLDQGWAAANLTFFDFSDERLVEQVSPRMIVDIRPIGISDQEPRIFLFDEIQNALGWQKWLKSAVDQARRQTGPRSRFIVTGSAAASLRGGSVESGQGRWDELAIEGLTFSEYRALRAPSRDTGPPAALEPGAFERYLALGGFPEHVRSEVLLRDVRRQLRDDIAERAILRDLSQSGVDVDRVRRLFVYLVTESGNIWNQGGRAADIGANRKSIPDWLSLLEQTRLVIRLERETGKKASARLRSQPKIFAADHGLITAFSTQIAPEQQADVRARVFEAVVFRHLREVARGGKADLTFARLQDDLEIDFVLRHPTGAVGIEVTSSQKADARKLGRLAEAARTLGIDRKLLIHGGLDSVREGDIEVVPLHEFLVEPERYVGGKP